MPSSSSWCSSGTVIVERMPCMMMEWAPEKRLSMVASDDSTAALLLHDLGQDRFGQHDLLVLAVARLGDAGLGNAVLHEQDDAAVGGDELEGLHDDLLEQDARGRPRGRWTGRARGRGAASRSRGAAPRRRRSRVRAGTRAVGGALDLLADEGLGGRGRDGHLLEQRVAAQTVSWKVRVVEPSMISSPSLQHVLAHALAAQERAVQAAEVAEQETAVRLPHDLRVLLGDDAVQDLQRVVGVPPDRVDGAELVLAALVAAGDDDLGHAERSPAGDAQERHHTLAGGGIPRLKRGDLLRVPGVPGVPEVVKWSAFGLDRRSCHN